MLSPIASWKAELAPDYMQIKSNSFLVINVVCFQHTSQNLHERETAGDCKPKNNKDDPFHDEVYKNHPR